MTRHRRLRALHDLAFMSLLFSTMFAYADGLGPIQLLSGLGQPLRANIPFSNNGETELGSACVSAKLALTDGTFITTPRISVARGKRTGIAYISTKQNINEPAVLLHVEIGCSAPTQRNYQLLLDPANGAATSSVTDTHGTLRNTLPHPQSQIHSQSSYKATGTAVPSWTPLKYHTKQSDAKKIDQGKSRETVQGMTLVREMELPARSANQIVGASSDNTPTWSSGDGNVLLLKMSDDLADPGNADDTQRNDEFRAEQLRFATIINDEDAKRNADAALKAEQEKTRLLQAERERKLQQAQAEKLAQEDKRKELWSIARGIGTGALVLLGLIAIVWLARKILIPKRPQTRHHWKNYQAASDTLIADLSTQTMLDSEFLTTVGDNYSTTVFSDTQFEPDTVIDYGFVEESLDDADDFNNSTPIDAEPATTSNVISTPKGNAIATPSEPDTPTSSLAASQTPATAGVATKPATPPANVPSSEAPTVVKPKPATTEVRSAPAAGAQAGTDQTPQPPPAKSAIANGQPKIAKSTSPTLEIKDIADLMQQAEFWMLLHDPFRAIEILEPYRDIAHPESPVPWIYLLDLYRMVGDKKKYEALIARIENIFNAKIPKWDGQFGITPRSLNDFPHVVEKICDLWETNEIEPYLESLLLDNRDGARQGFDLPVYRNIIQLITLAREPKESKQQEQLRFEKAQAILFSQQIPQLNEVASAAEIESSKTTSAEKKVEPGTTPSNPTLDTKLAATVIPDHTKSNAENPKATNDFSKNSNASVAPNEIAVADEDHADYTSASSMETKLELAKVYQEIGEKDGARELLYEVIKDGSADQSEKAKVMLKRIT